MARIEGGARRTATTVRLELLRTEELSHRRPARDSPWVRPEPGRCVVSIACPPCANFPNQSQWFHQF